MFKNTQIGICRSTIFRLCHSIRRIFLLLLFLFRFSMTLPLVFGLVDESFFFVLPMTRTEFIARRFIVANRLN